MTWNEMSIYQKILAILISLLAIGGCAYVFGYGRLW